MRERERERPFCRNRQGLWQRSGDSASSTQTPSDARSIREHAIRQDLPLSTTIHHSRPQSKPTRSARQSEAEQTFELFWLIIFILSIVT